MARAATIALTGLAGVLSGVVAARDRKLIEEKEKHAKKGRDLEQRIKLATLEGQQLKNSAETLAAGVKKEQNQFRKTLTEALGQQQPPIQTQPTPQAEFGMDPSLSQPPTGPFPGADVPTPLPSRGTIAANLPQGAKIAEQVHGPLPTTPKPRSAKDQLVASAIESLGRGEPLPGLSMEQTRALLPGLGKPSSSVEVNVDASTKRIGKASPVAIAKPLATFRTLGDIDSMYKASKGAFTGKLDSKVQGVLSFFDQASPEREDFASAVELFGIQTRKFYAGTQQTPGELKALNRVIPSLSNGDVKFESNIRQTRKNVKRELVALIEVLALGDTETQKKLLGLIELGTKLLAGRSGSDKPVSEMTDDELRNAAQ